MRWACQYTFPRRHHSQSLVRTLMNLADLLPPKRRRRGGNAGARACREMRARSRDAMPAHGARLLRLTSAAHLANVINAIWPLIARDWRGCGRQSQQSPTSTIRICICCRSWTTCSSKPCASCCLCTRVGSPVSDCYLDWHSQNIDHQRPVSVGHSFSSLVLISQLCWQRLWLRVLCEQYSYITYSERFFM